MSLIEILVVLVIMGAIASAVGFSVLRSLERSRGQDTKARARTIQSGAIAYQMDHPGECPEIADLLSSDVLDRTTDHNDGWGRPFAVDCEGTTVHVWSRGSDGQQGTEDDIGF